MIQEMAQFILCLVGAIVLTAVVCFLGIVIVGLIFECFDRHPVASSIIASLIFIALIIIALV